jgi:tetratricopeptide (TPR) repeat protein
VGKLPSARPEGLEPDALLQVDSACDSFEASWKSAQTSGERPLIENFLGETPQPERSVLLRELIALDIHYRQRVGEAPQAEEYCRRFPAEAAVVADLWSADSPSTALPAPCPIPVSPSPDEVGLPSVPGYEVLEELGRGGMGVVYKARQLGLERLVALKMILHADYAGAQQRVRFRAEAEAVAQLRHPHIVQVYEVGEHRGKLFYSLEYCPGGNLAQWLRAHPLPPAKAARLVEALARATQTAHASRIVHRDLKPANVLLTSEGSPCIADFGLAKRLDVTAATLTGMVLGTPSYMAPEQAEGNAKEVGPPADVYALGAILYECLTGRPPFMAATTMDTLFQVVHEEPVPVRQLNPQVPADLDTICAKCLQKEPGRRYESAGELALDLQRFLAGEPIRARPVGLIERAVKWARRRPAAAGLVAALALLVVLATGGAWWLSRQRDIARGRQQAANRDVRLIVEGGRNLLDEGWPVNDTRKLTQAKAEADRAVKMGQDGEADATVRREAAAFQEEANEKVLRANKDRVLLDALLEVASPRETAMDVVSDPGAGLTTVGQLSVDQQYAAAFRHWGLEVDDTPEEEVAKRLSAEPAPVVREVIAALDVWMLWRRRQKGSEGRWRHLFEIAERLDASASRRQLRALLVGTSPVRAESVVGLLGAWPRWPALWEIQRGRNWRPLLQLGSQITPATEPVLTLVLFAQGSSEVGDDAGAESVLRQAVASRPDEVVLLHALARTLRRQGPSRLTETIGWHQAARSRRPELGIALAQTLIQAGRAGEAEAVLHDLIRRQPGNPERHFHLGVALIKQKKWSGAVRAFRKAIDLERTFAEAHYNLGLALWEQANLREAEAAIREAIAQKRDFADAYNHLGNILFKQKNLKEALEAYTKAVRIKPDFALAYNNLGNAHAGREEDWPKAEAAFKEAIRIQPDLALAHYNLSGTLLDLKKWSAAATACQEALRLRPHEAAHWGAYYNLACAALGAAASKPADEEKAPFRRQALDSLRADLAWWARAAGRNEVGASEVVERMLHWLTDRDLASVRGGRLAKLPAAERADWQKLWADVDALLRNAKAEARPG